MNLNFIELLTVLQLITIRNSSDSNNIKPQAIKKASKIKQIRFLHSTPESSAYNFFLPPSSALKIVGGLHCGP